MVENQRSKLFLIMIPVLIFFSDPVRGAEAPRFVLPTLEGDRFVSSEEIFGAADATFLVFWDSGCDRCSAKLAECEEFYSRVRGGGIQVYGVAGDDSGDAGFGAAAGSAKVTFPQLRDRGRRAGSAYGVAPSTVAIFLIDGNGMIIASREGPQGEMDAVMEDMMVAPPDGKDDRGSVVRSGAEALGITFEGRVRMKFLSVDTEGDDAVGPYGEPLDQGNSLLQRYELEIAKSIGTHLSAGGLLRISNEGLDILRSGPDYYDSEWGSVFAEADYGRFGFRLGYFTMHMTPLTMMRWDWDDNPRTGGDAGCGCGAAGGIMIVQSLEELGPELTFEGALVRFKAGDLSTRVFYAIPRRARHNTANEYQFGGRESACYSFEMFGLTSQWQRYDSRTGSNWSASLNVAGTREDPESADPASLGYAPFERHDSEMITLAGSVPLIRLVDVTGEWIVYNNTRGYDLGLAHDGRDEFEGSGGLAGIKIAEGGRYSLRADYQRLTSGFYSPFAALSYQAGREGVRAKCRLEMPGGWSSLQLFYKRHFGTEAPAADAEKDDLMFAGVTFDVETESGAGGSISYLDRHEWRPGDVLDFDDSRRTWTAALRFRFEPVTWVEGMYQRIENDISSAGESAGSKTDIFSLYFRAAF